MLLPSQTLELHEISNLHALQISYCAPLLVSISSVGNDPGQEKKAGQSVLFFDVLFFDVHERQSAVESQRIDQHCLVNQVLANL